MKITKGNLSTFPWNFLGGKKYFFRYGIYVCQILPKLKFLDSQPLLKIQPEDSLKLELTFTKVTLQKSQSLTVYQTPPETKSKLSFGKLRYKYIGKHSEGNRFIGNKDL